VPEFGTDNSVCCVLEGRSLRCTAVAVGIRSRPLLVLKRDPYPPWAFFTIALPEHWYLLFVDFISAYRTSRLSQNTREIKRYGDFVLFFFFFFFFIHQRSCEINRRLVFILSLSLITLFCAADMGKASVRACSRRA